MAKLKLSKIITIITEPGLSRIFMLNGRNLVCTTEAAWVWSQRDCLKFYRLP